MKIRDGYQKIILANETYLMPYGQNAASRAHALKLNATSEFLWDALVSGLDEKQLLSLAAKEFEATEEDLPVLREDIRHFISALAANGIVQLSDSDKPHSSYEPSYYQIGPLVFAYYGPCELYDRFFKKFACDKTEHADQEIYLKIGMPRFKENGSILLRTEELQICEADSLYRFFFQRNDHSQGWRPHYRVLRSGRFRRGTYRAGISCIAICLPASCAEASFVRASLGFLSL